MHLSVSETRRSVATRPKVSSSTRPPYVAGPTPGGYRRTVYRFLLTRRWLGLLAVALLVAATCVQLGRWQLHRLEARHANNDLITSNASSRPVPAADLLGVGDGPAADRQYARVRATGRYDTAHQLLVRNRPHDGQVGLLRRGAAGHRRRARRCSSTGAGCPRASPRPTYPTYRHLLPGT